MDVSQAADNRTDATPAPLFNSSAYMDDRDALLVNTSAYTRDLRELNAIPHYVPSKASACRFCAMCKRGNVTDKAIKKCKSACNTCPNAVTLGAKSVFNIEIDGVIATQYVRSAPTGGGGRALQTDTRNGIDIMQMGTTIFEGTPCVLPAWMERAVCGQACNGTQHGRLDALHAKQDRWHFRAARFPLSAA